VIRPASESSVPAYTVGAIEEDSDKSVSLFTLLFGYRVVHDPGMVTVPRENPPSDTERIVFVTANFSTIVLIQDERSELGTGV
jgi:hypothetical protein